MCFRSNHSIAKWVVYLRIFLLVIVGSSKCRNSPRRADVWPWWTDHRGIAYARTFYELEISGFAENLRSPFYHCRGLTDRLFA